MHSATSIFRYLDHWDLICGCKIERCYNKSGSRILAVGLSPEIGTLVAVDSNGSIIGWKVKSSEQELNHLRKKTFEGFAVNNLDPSYMERECISLQGHQDVMLVTHGANDIWILVQLKNHSKLYHCDATNGRIILINDNIQFEASSLVVCGGNEVVMTSHKDQLIGWMNKDGGIKTHSFASIADCIESSLQMPCIQATPSGIAIITQNKVVLFHPDTKPHVISVPDLASTKSASVNGTLVLMNLELMVFIDTTKGVSLGTFKYYFKPESVDDVRLTHDGKYLIHISDQKELRLLRVSNQRLLAHYTMYSDVKSIEVSANNWFICIGTADKRLYVLLIADPDEPQHKERIKYVRENNPVMTQDEVNVLMSEINHPNASSDEYIYADCVSELNLEGDGRQSRSRISSNMTEVSNESNTISRQGNWAPVEMKEMRASPVSHTVASKHVCNMQ